MHLSRSILFVGALLLYVRLYWGIDFTDESYMILNAVGPLWGAKPFAAEMMISQTGSLLMTPFAFIFKIINPQFTGVVLFFRHLYFAAAVLTSLAVFRFLRGKMADHDRALTALLALVFIPACLPVPSYNSLMMFFALAGQIMLLSDRAFGAGLLHSLAAFSHPAFLAGAGVSFFTGKRKRYARGWILFFALAAALVLVAGWDSLRRAFELSSQSSTFGGAAKLEMMWREFLGYWRRPLIAALWAAACALAGFAGRLNWAVALGGFALTQDFFIPEEVAYGLHQRFVCYGLFSALLIICDRNGWHDGENRRWIARLWLPSFIAGLSVAFVSSNGLVMAPLGWLGCLVYAFWRMPRHWRTAALLIVLIQAQIFTLTHFYRDDSLAKLDAQVTEGPFAGIYTTYQRRNFIAEFTEQMDKLGRSGTIFIYDMFAAGYLLTHLKPNGPAYMPILPQWMPQTRAPLAEYFKDENHLPDVAVEFFKFPFGATNVVTVNPRGVDPYNDPFKEFFLRTGRYETVFDSDLYRILKRR